MLAKLVTAVLILFASTISPASNEKLSETQIVELTAEVIKYVSNDFHLSDPPRWVWLKLPEKRFPQLSASIRKELAKKYKVVMKESDLPSDARYVGVPYTSWNGFMLAIEAHKIRPGRIKITYSYYGGRFAPSKQTIQYEWATPKWKIVSQSGMIIY